MAEEEACSLLGVASVWHALTRPVPISPSRVSSLAAVVATPKLDGRRAALVLRRDEVIEITSDGTRVLNWQIPFADLMVLDAECYEATYHVFDVLVFAGRDVRHLTLFQRVCIIDKLDFPTMMRPKPYLFLSDALSTPTDIVEAAWRQCSKSITDGLILQNATDPYWAPPLKFKESLTSDLVLQKARSGSGFVFLAKDIKKQLRVVKDKRGLPLRVQNLTHKVALALAQQPKGIVVECLRYVKDGGVRIKRLRPDRSEPNRLAVVEENVKLQDLGCNRRVWLTKTLRSLNSSKRCVDNYEEALWRIVATDAIALTTKAKEEVSRVTVVYPKRRDDGFVERNTPHWIRRIEIFNSARCCDGALVLFPLSLEDFLENNEVSMLQGAAFVAGIASAQGLEKLEEALAIAEKQILSDSSSSANFAAVYGISKTMAMRCTRSFILRLSPR